MKARARNTGEGKVEVSIENPAGGPVAFFIRIALVNRETKKRLLPLFFSDNYVSVEPGEKRTFTLEDPQGKGTAGDLVSLSGWNVPPTYLTID